MSGAVVGALFGMWLLVFLIICRGVSQSGKIAVVTVSAPYLLLTILLIKVFTLEGSG